VVAIEHARVRLWRREVRASESAQLDRVELKNARASDLVRELEEAPVSGLVDVMNLAAEALPVVEARGAPDWVRNFDGAVALRVAGHALEPILNASLRGEQPVARLAGRTRLEFQPAVVALLRGTSRTARVAREGLSSSLRTRQHPALLAARRRACCLQR